MALPKINEHLNFVMTIPSLGKQVKYRPYLVQEEKVLLQAFESKDPSTCLQAMTDTLSATIDPREGIDVAKLATFDVEYMFTQVRAKSVGEVSTILINCKKCEEQNEYQIDLDELEVEVPVGQNIREVTDNIRVEMRYPSYDVMLKQEKEGDEFEKALDVVTHCMVAIHTGEERIDCADESKEDLLDFVSSMTAAQLKNVTSFIEDMPALKHNAEFLCQHCTEKNELELKGLSDFF